MESSSMDANTILAYLKAKHQRGLISTDRYDNLVNDLKKPCYSSEEEKKIVSECKSLVDAYRKRSCRVPKKEFDAMLATINGYVDGSSPLMTAFRSSMVEFLDDVETATLACVLEEEGKLVGCSAAGLVKAMEGLARRVVPAEDGAEVGRGGRSSGQCFVCREELGEKGSVVRMTDCGYSCHSRCLLQWHGENADCPNFCGFLLERAEEDK